MVFLRRQNENPTEGAIREIKKRWYRIMLKNKAKKYAIVVRLNLDL